MWRTYRIRNAATGTIVHEYAPDLLTAFSNVRARGAGSATLRCLGSHDDPFGDMMSQSAFARGVSQ